MRALDHLAANLNARDADTLAIALEVRADAFQTALGSGIAPDMQEAWAYRETLCREWARAFRAIPAE